MANTPHKFVNGEMVELTQQEIDEIEAVRQNAALTLQVDKELVRQERNVLLLKTDWTQLPDSTANKEAWAAYRQALRDVPTQSGFPLTVVWPVPPT